ncbi:MAG TPA: hemolysin family protein [Blastocatellia bacterium]|nr:hemolysin family protein [Blastocatellia bacterium]
MESSLSSVLVRLALVLLLVLANGFFVAAEYALVSVRRSRIASLASQGSKRAQRVLGILETLTAYISATQLGVTLASLALGWVGEETMAEILGPLFQRAFGSFSVVAAHTASIVVAYIAITYLHVVLGELVPKAISLEKAEPVALAVAPPVQIFYKMFKAPIWVLNHSGVMVLRWLGLRATAEHAGIYSEEELRGLIALSQKSGHVLEDERQLINNVFDFTEMTVESVMNPRTQIESLDAELTPAQMLDCFEQVGYSRMPVYRGTLDNILGIVLHKDLSRMVRHGGEISEIIRPAVFLPTTVKLHEALRSLRRSSAHMAMVVDEHGGVEGLVTLEDLLEEIVGDIRDEHDEVLAQQIKKESEDTFKVSGALSIRDANRSLQLGLPESDSYHTVAGFMMARAGRLLRPGDQIEYNGLRLTVESTERNRIVEAKVEKLKEEDVPAPTVAS